MVVLERRQRPDVVVLDVEPAAAQLVHGGVLVAGVPEHDGIDDEAEGAELVLLAFPVELASLAVEDGAGKSVAALGAVELGEDPSAVGFVVEVGVPVRMLSPTVDATRQRSSQWPGLIGHLGSAYGRNGGVRQHLGVMNAEVEAAGQR